ncbi:hypothetical protein pb186bvf_011244 [Paramecium bursaria]
MSQLSIIRYRIKIQLMIKLRMNTNYKGNLYFKEQLYFTHLIQPQFVFQINKHYLFIIIFLYVLNTFIFNNNFYRKI